MSPKTSESLQLPQLRSETESLCQVMLRFSAGPPYEDVAFKIVNREWNLSHKLLVCWESGRGKAACFGVLRRSFQVQSIANHDVRLMFGPWVSASQGDSVCPGEDVVKCCKELQRFDWGLASEWSLTEGSCSSTSMWSAGDTDVDKGRSPMKTQDLGSAVRRLRRDQLWISDSCWILFCIVLFFDSADVFSCVYTSHGGFQPCSWPKKQSSVSRSAWPWGAPLRRHSCRLWGGAMRQKPPWASASLEKAVPKCWDLKSSSYNMLEVCPRFESLFGRIICCYFLGGVHGSLFLDFNFWKSPGGESSKQSYGGSQSNAQLGAQCTTLVFLLLMIFSLYRLWSFGYRILFWPEDTHSQVSWGQQPT